jgi:drug/metabolite transporter (DMT)-like permease
MAGLDASGNQMSGSRVTTQRSRTAGIPQPSLRSRRAPCFTFLVGAIGGQSAAAVSGEETAAQPSWPGHAAMLVTTVLWGTLIPLLDILLAHFDAYSLSALRYGIAGVLLVPMLVFGEAGFLRSLPLGKVVLLGVVGIAGFTTLYTLGIAHSDPGTAIVVNAATPIISAVFATLVYRVPFEKGVGAAFGGVIATLGHERGALGFRGGELLLVVAALVWAWYSITAQKWLGHYRQSQLTAVTLMSASVGLVIADLAGMGVGVTQIPAWPPLGILALIVFVGFGSTFTGIMCWNFAVGRLGVVVATLYLSLVPVIGMITAAALGKPPTAMQLVGGAIVLAGIAQLHLRRLYRLRAAAN